MQLILEEQKHCWCINHFAYGIGGLGNDNDKLKGYCTPNQKLACFVLYLKIINNSLKIIYAPCRKLSKEPKNGFEILVCQAVFKT